ncbi:MAG: UPF0149 family protein, partial [Gammaproteobacteria bacterium]
LAAPQRPADTLNYHEVQGLLFAIACAPEVVMPSEWMPLIFDEQEAGYADPAEAQSVIQALMSLYNAVNSRVFAGDVKLPDDITPAPQAVDNLGGSTALGQWSRGFFLGHDWLSELWDRYTPDSLDEELGSSLMILTFFSSRELAEAYYREVASSSGQTLEMFAEKLRGLFEDAMRGYAHLGRSIQSVLAEQAQPQQPSRSGKKIGRNAPCPCGSGRKYKHCCLH